MWHEDSLLRAHLAGDNADNRGAAVGPGADVDARRPAPPPPPVRPERPRGPAAGTAEIRAIICAYPWPCAEALAVVYGPTPPNSRAPGGCANGESGGNPRAQNGDHAGLFQIARYWHEQRFTRRGWSWEQDAFDAERNAAIAYELWSDSGWGPWSCRP